MTLKVVARAKTKVVIWRPFPSPTQRDRVLPSLLSFPNVLRPPRQNSEKENDEALVNRWVELADVLNAKKKIPKKKSAA